MYYKCQTAHKTTDTSWSYNITKWENAIPIPDQTAERITSERVNLFSNLGLPEILHSDQGRHFESPNLSQTLEVFRVKKSRTTAHRPQGDGMVERFSRSLQLLHP